MNFARNKISNLFKILIFAIAIYAQIIPEQLIASSTGIGRIRQCNFETGYIADDDGLSYDPTWGGKDARFVLSNPVCLAIILSSYAVVKGSIAGMNRVCTGAYNPRITPSLFTDFAEITANGVRAAANKDPACGAASLGALTSLGVFAGELGIVYAIAKSTYNNTKICGHNWYAPNPKEYNLYAEDYAKTMPSSSPGLTMREVIDACRDAESRTDFDDNHSQSCDELISTDNKYYREYMYGGVEVEDNPNSGEVCYDPYTIRNDENSISSTNPLTSTSKYSPQKYYMKGFEEGNYNCQKYNITGNDPLTNEAMTAERKADFQRAYNCCVNRAQSFVCINFRGKKTFCQAGSNCSLTAGEVTSSEGFGAVTFSAKSVDRNSKICVETYSLCPYNFAISGGSEVCEYFKDSPNLDRRMLDEGNCDGRSEVRNNDCELNKRAGKCKNYCQYMTHCVKTSNYHMRNPATASPYFSEACINFVGDSRNSMAYGSGIFAGSMRHLSAPIVQCFKETIENVFHNKAGHSRCIQDRVEGGIDMTGSCESGFAYKKGDQVKEESFFETIQQTLNYSIRVGLGLAIMFYGMKILSASGEIKRKDMMLFIVKLAIVMYFATGTAWKDTFFDGIYQTSNFLSDLVFKIQVSDIEEKRDGCQFGRSAYTSINSGSINEIGLLNSYPKGKEYLAIWDTLDCKIARYMGFGPEASVASIAMLIFAGLLIGSIGAYFVTVLFFFAFLMIRTTIFAIHIFLASSIAIILLVFISPIAITCILTEKTKDIFNNWLKQLISYALQPMILMVYMAIFISVLDKSLTGSAFYTGTAPVKTILCSKQCVNPNGSIAVGIEIDDCNTDNRQVVNPKSDSFECLISANAFSNFPGLEIVGISIPFVLDIFLEDGRKKIFTLIRNLVLVYFLYKFMEEIPNIASQLIGGGTLSKAKNPLLKTIPIFKNASGILVGLQKRGGRVAKSKAKNIKKNIGKNLKSNNKGAEKSKSDSEDSKGGGESE